MSFQNLSELIIHAPFSAQFPLSLFLVFLLVHLSLVLKFSVVLSPPEDPQSSIFQPESYLNRIMFSVKMTFCSLKLQNVSATWRFTL